MRKPAAGTLISAGQIMTKYRISTPTLYRLLNLNHAGLPVFPSPVEGSKIHSIWLATAVYEWFKLYDRYKAERSRSSQVLRRTKEQLSKGDRLFVSDIAELYNRSSASVIYLTKKLGPDAPRFPEAIYIADRPSWDSLEIQAFMIAYQSYLKEGRIKRGKHRSQMNDLRRCALRTVEQGSVE